MIPRQASDMAIAHDVIAERIRHADHVRLARAVSRRHPHGGPLRPVGRLLVRLGIALGGGPEAPTTAVTLSPVRPR